MARTKKTNGSNGSNGEGLNSSNAVAKRAYEIYQNRGGTDGADLDDWLEAERELKGPSDVTGPAPSATRAPAKPRRRKPSAETAV
jgi:hypothetical protein